MDNYCTPLAAILRKAQGCIDPDTGDIVDVGGEVMQLRKICDTLRAEFAESRRDAERYRWLRNNSNEQSWWGAATLGRWLDPCGYDRRVDAAMAAKEE